MGVSKSDLRAETISSTTEEEAPFPLFKESLAYQAQLFARLAQNDYMARISGTGIAPAQAYVLGELWFNEPLSQVDLARRLDIGKATVGQTLARLERAGVVERRRIKSDRRVVMVHLTEKGRALREPLRLATIEQADMLEDRLGKERVAQLTELLRHANEMLVNAFPQAVED
ncbi:MarR family transcriptional regulator (plasmid) [Sphingobium sp. SJ10-10]|uniref:MarR family winged helix-turn-helix transcriptional regulator n=1 Tax=Sphingobium sp. SJ10-10 TaxID=3114999 RepID=UPI002E17C14A|nr:MarR family transcriptional regulator [Sphingobium sp. SJ10-10]